MGFIGLVSIVKIVADSGGQIDFGGAGTTTQLCTYTPSTSGNFMVSAYLIAHNTAGSASIEITYTDTQATYTNVALCSSGSTPTFSPTWSTIMIWAVAGNAITVNLVASAAFAGDAQGDAVIWSIA